MIAATEANMLAEVFTNLLRHRAFLVAWKIAKYIPIPKPRKTDMSVPKNLRSISLLSYLGKVFEKYLASWRA